MEPESILSGLKSYSRRKLFDLLKYNLKVKEFINKTITKDFLANITAQK